MKELIPNKKSIAVTLVASLVVGLFGGVQSVRMANAAEKQGNLKSLNTAVSSEIIRYAEKAAGTQEESAYAYHQDFNNMNTSDDLKKVATASTGSSLELKYDQQHKGYLKHTSEKNKDKSLGINFGNSVKTLRDYTVEVDVQLKAGKGTFNSEILFTDTAFTTSFGEDSPVTADYIFKLSTDYHKTGVPNAMWYINDGVASIELPNESTWVTIKLVVEYGREKDGSIKDLHWEIIRRGTTALITNKAQGDIPITGTGKLKGIYALTGRDGGETCIDNIRVSRYNETVPDYTQLTYGGAEASVAKYINQNTPKAREEKNTCVIDAKNSQTCGKDSYKLSSSGAFDTTVVFNNRSDGTKVENNYQMVFSNEPVSNKTSAYNETVVNANGSNLTGQNYTFKKSVDDAIFNEIMKAAEVTLNANWDASNNTVTVTTSAVSLEDDSKSCTTVLTFEKTATDLYLTLAAENATVEILSIKNSQRVSQTSSLTETDTFHLGDDFDVSIDLDSMGTSNDVYVLKFKGTAGTEYIYANNRAEWEPAGGGVQDDTANVTYIPSSGFDTAFNAIMLSAHVKLRIIGNNNKITIKAYIISVYLEKSYICEREFTMTGDVELSLTVEQQASLEFHQFTYNPKVTEVDNSATTPSIQWYHTDNKNSDGTKIGGETKNTHALVKEDAGNYVYAIINNRRRVFFENKVKGIDIDIVKNSVKIATKKYDGEKTASIESIDFEVVDSKFQDVLSADKQYIELDTSLLNFDSPNAGTGKNVSGKIMLNGVWAKCYNLVNGGQITAIGDIEKAEPTYTIPTGLTAKVGQTLADVEPSLSGGFAWDNRTTSVGTTAGRPKFPATYTPSDTDNYEIVSVMIEVIVVDSSSTAPSVNPSGSLAPSSSVNPSGSPAPSSSVNPSGSPKPSSSVNPSGSPTVSASVNPSASPSVSPSASPSASSSPSPTVKPTATPRPTATPKPTRTPVPDDPYNPDDPYEDPLPEVDAAVLAKNKLGMNKKIRLTWEDKTLCVTWGTVDGVEGYDIYAAVVGDDFTNDTIAKSVEGNEEDSINVKKIDGDSPLDKDMYYKVKIRAYRMIDDRKQGIGDSLTMYIAARKDSYYTNVKKIKLKKSSFSLKKGKTAKIKPTLVKVSKSKSLLKTPGTKIRYVSSNTAVAKVNENGKIRAVGKGSCTIYAIALNGVRKKISVKVTA